MASVVQLLLGGALTMIGGAAATLLQAHLQSNARADEHAERRRESRRDKAQLVFQELGNLVQSYKDQWIYATRRATYQVSKKVPGMELDEPDSIAYPSVAAVEALVSIYFPAFAPIVASFSEEIKESAKGYSRRLTTYIKTHADNPDPAYVTVVHMEMAQDHAQRATAFADRLREAMRPEIDKLW